jgi:hypothetical protein
VVLSGIVFELVLSSERSCRGSTGFDARENREAGAFREGCGKDLRLVDRLQPDFQFGGRLDPSVVTQQVLLKGHEGFDPFGFAEKH